MEKEEKIEMLVEAQEKIHHAVELIKEAMVETGQKEAACKAYIIPHLEKWADGDNPYDATAIPRLIEHLREN